MRKTKAEMLVLAKMLSEYPDKQAEANGAAEILTNWMENIPIICGRADGNE